MFLSKKSCNFFGTCSGGFGADPITLRRPAGEGELGFSPAYG